MGAKSLFSSSFLKLSRCTSVLFSEQLGKVIKIIVPKLQRDLGHTLLSFSDFLCRRFHFISYHTIMKRFSRHFPEFGAEISAAHSYCICRSFRPYTFRYMLLNVLNCTDANTDIICFTVAV